MDETGLEKKSFSFPLTDENRRLVSLLLLNHIKSFKPGIKALYDLLDESLKKDSSGEETLTFEGFRRQIRRDIEELSGLTGKPDELRAYFENQKKKSNKLQIRITPNDILLYNILLKLGIKFEGLFDKDNPGGKIEESHYNRLFFEEGTRLNYDLLKKIDKKTDSIIEKDAMQRIRRTFSKSSVFIMSFFNMFHLYTQNYDNPQKNGFAFAKSENQERKKVSNEKIYSNGCFLVSNLTPFIPKKSRLYSLYNRINASENDDVLYGRMFNPLFILIFFMNIMCDFLASLIRSGKAFFHISKEMFLDMYDDGTTNEKIKASFDKCYKRTKYFINYLCKEKINVTDKLCVEIERALIKFIYCSNELFQKPLPHFNIDLNIKKTYGRRKINEIMNNAFQGNNFGILEVNCYYTVKEADLEKIDVEYIKSIDEIQEKINRDYIVQEQDASNG
jgi:hypothetical protein